MSFIPGNTGVASSFPDGFLVADGSVTAPTFKFSDTQTGFYRPGTNQWALASAGVQSWLVGATGTSTFTNNNNPGLVLHRANVSNGAGAHLVFGNDSPGGTTDRSEITGYAGTGRALNFEFKGGGVTYGTLSAVGAWTLGQSGFTGQHLLRGITKTQDFRVSTDGVGSGTFNNQSTSNVSLLECVLGGTTFTGFANGANGKVLYIVVSNGGVTLNHNDAASSGGNRIFTITGANVTRTSGGFTLVYDSNNSRWVQVG